MLYFLSTLTISFVLLKLFILFSHQLGIVDIPNKRSSHNESTPSSSGIVIVVTVALVLLFVDLKNIQNYSFSIIGIFLVFILGIYDDFKNSPPLWKLIIILVSTLFICLDGFVIENIGTYFSYTIPLLWLSVPFTLLIVIGFTNALNLIDGLDGLAGGISIVIFLSLWFIGQKNNDPLLSLISPIIIFSLLGFLIFNWNPAKIFMGDSGSLTIGFVISIFSIRAVNYIQPIAVLYILAVPITDLIISIVRRKMSNRPIFAPDRCHIHHILFDRFNGNVKKTVLVIVAVQCLYALFGLFIVTTMPQEVALLLFVLGIFSWYILLKKISKEKYDVIPINKGKS